MCNNDVMIHEFIAVAFSTDNGLLKYRYYETNSFFIQVSLLRP